MDDVMTNRKQCDESDARTLAVGGSLDTDVDVTLIDCGSFCDVRGSPVEPQDVTKNVDEEPAVDVEVCSDVSTPVPKKKRGRRSKREMLQMGAAEEPATYELRQGYRILSELMADGVKSVNSVFMNYPVGDSEEEQYRQKVPSPMWLTKMRQKFGNQDYSSITDFVKDFRLMLENCYRYNGPDHYVSKKAQKLEMMLEQKLALLSREIRLKTTIEATVGTGTPLSADQTLDDSISKEGVDGDAQGRRVRRATAAPLPCGGASGTLTASSSTGLLSRLREEEKEKERDARRRQQEDRRKEQEQYLQELQKWEQSFVDEQTRNELLSMWELPQIGHFLFLCREPLNIGEIAQHELERILLMPVESRTLELLMTSLLSSPLQRARMYQHPPMPYAVWEPKLRGLLDAWYKTVDIATNDLVFVGEKLGIDNRFFGVVGRSNPLLRKSFIDLTYLQKVWILKALIEYCMHTQDSLREAIDMQPAEEARESVLGTDADGRTYLHFPQFCGADLRVYRIADEPTRALDRLPAVKSLRKKCSRTIPKPTLPTANPQDSARPTCRGSKQVSCGAVAGNDGIAGSIQASSVTGKRSKRQLAARSRGPAHEVLATPTRRSTRNVLKQLCAEDATVSTDQGGTSDLANGSYDLPTPLVDASPSFGDIVMTSKGLHETLATGTNRMATRSRSSVSPVLSPLTCRANNSSGKAADDENFDIKKEPSCPFLQSSSPRCSALDIKHDRQDCESDPVRDAHQSGCATPCGSPKSNGHRNKANSAVDAADEELVTHVADLEAFRLVATSVSELRSLAASFPDSQGSGSSNTESAATGRKHKSATAVQKQQLCEAELRTNLLYLLKELEPWEGKLELARRRANEKLRQEKATYRPPEAIADSELLLEWEAEDGTASKSPDQRDTGSEYSEGTTNRSAVQDVGDTTSAQPTNAEMSVGESWDISSFGRLRKRRIIPNNVEDSGMPRKRQPTSGAAEFQDASIIVSQEIEHHDATTKVTEDTNAGGQCTVGNHYSAITSIDVSGASSTRTAPVAVPAAGCATSVCGTNSDHYTFININGRNYLVPVAQLRSLFGQTGLTVVPSNFRPGVTATTSSTTASDPVGPSANASCSEQAALGAGLGSQASAKEMQSRAASEMQGLTAHTDPLTAGDVVTACSSSQPIGTLRRRPYLPRWGSGPLEQAIYAIDSQYMQTGPSNAVAGTTEQGSRLAKGSTLACKTQSGESVHSVGSVSLPAGLARIGISPTCDVNGSKEAQCSTSVLCSTMPAAVSALGSSVVLSVSAVGPSVPSYGVATASDRAYLQINQSPFTTRLFVPANTMGNCTVSGIPHTTSSINESAAGRSSDVGQACQAAVAAVACYTSSPATSGQGSVPAALGTSSCVTGVPRRPGQGQGLLLAYVPSAAGVSQSVGNGVIKTGANILSTIKYVNGGAISQVSPMENLVSSAPDQLLHHQQAQCRPPLNVSIAKALPTSNSSQVSSSYKPLLPAPVPQAQPLLLLNINGRNPARQTAPVAATQVGGEVKNGIQKPQSSNASSTADHAS